MYEAEYRYALKNAGFDGFRVLLFKDSDGIKAESGEPGLKFTVDFGFGMVDLVQDRVDAERVRVEGGGGIAELQGEFVLALSCIVTLRCRTRRCGSAARMRYRD